MKLVLDEKIAHGSHPVLQWIMDTIYILRDPADNIKIDNEEPTERLTAWSPPS